MGNEKLGLVGLAGVLMLVAFLVGTSNIEPSFIRGGFALGCIIGAILSIIAVVKME